MFKNLNSDKKMQLLFMSMILIIPAFFNGGAGNIGTALILILTLPLAWFSARRIRHNFLWPKFNLFWAISLFVFWAGLSIIWAADRYGALYELLRWVAYIIIFISSFIWLSDDKEKRPAQFRLFSIILIAFASLLSAIGLYYFFSSQTFDYLRLRSVFNYHNPFGGFLLMVLPLALGWFLLEKKKIWKYYIGAAAFLLSLSFVLTYSRGSWLSLLLVSPFLIWGVLKKADSRLKILRDLVFFIIIVGISANAAYAIKHWQKAGLENRGAAVGIVKSVQAEEGSKIISEEPEAAPEEPSSLDQRLHYWKGAMRVFMSSPVVGSGFNTFGTTYRQYVDNPIYYASDPHNIYLKAMAELGAVGLALWLAFIMGVLWVIIRLIFFKKHDIFILGLCLGIIAALAHNEVDGDWQYASNAVLFFMMLGLLYKEYAGHKFKGHKEMLGAFKAKMIVISAIVFVCGSAVFASDVYYERGKAFLSEDTPKIDEAKTEFSRALFANPADPQYRLSLARIYASKIEKPNDDNYKKAVKYIGQAEEMAPRDYRAPYLKASVYERNFSLAASEAGENDYADADTSRDDKSKVIESLREAEKYAPVGIPEISYRLGRNYFEDKEYEELAKYLPQKLDVYSEFLDSPYWMTERPKDEIKSIVANSYNLLGASYFFLGRDEECKEAFLKGIKISPRTIFNYDNLIKVYKELGENDKACGTIGMAREYYPDLFEEEYKELKCGEGE